MLPIFCGIGHIIAEPHIIHTAAAQNLQILFSAINGKSLLFPIRRYSRRVRSLYMHISKVVLSLHGFLGHHDIFRPARLRINRSHTQHTADQKIRVYLMSL